MFGEKALAQMYGGIDRCGNDKSYGNSELYVFRKDNIMKRIVSIIAILAVVIGCSVMSVADSSASHQYKNHTESASLYNSHINYQLTVAVEVWDSNYNLGYKGDSVTTWALDHEASASVNNLAATRGYYAYATKDSGGNLVSSGCGYGWDS